MHKSFHENHMVLNPGKCHYMLIGNKSHDNKIILNGVALKTSNEEKLLRVLIDKNLSFDIHIKSMCRKASQKISVLARLSNQLTNTQKFSLVNSVIKSQFTYCPLLWMFCHVP